MANIRWKGFGRRELRGYVWPHTGAVVDVSEGDAELFLQFADQFELVTGPEESAGPPAEDTSEDNEEED
jgi:hypothetical protein